MTIDGKNVIHLFFSSEKEEGRVLYTVADSEGVQGVNPPPRPTFLNIP